MTQLGIIAKLDELNIQACYAVGPIAQSVEQRTFNPWVDGSSPSGPTRALLGFRIGSADHENASSIFRVCVSIKNTKAFIKDFPTSPF